LAACCKAGQAGKTAPNSQNARNSMASKPMPGAGMSEAEVVLVLAGLDFFEREIEGMAGQQRAGK
jgi:hypothetical protein